MAKAFQALCLMAAAIIFCAAPLAAQSVQLGAPPAVIDSSVMNYVAGYVIHNFNPKFYELGVDTVFIWRTRLVKSVSGEGYTGWAGEFLPVPLMGLRSKKERSISLIKYSDGRGLTLSVASESWGVGTDSSLSCRGLYPTLELYDSLSLIWRTTPAMIKPSLSQPNWAAMTEITLTLTTVGGGHGVITRPLNLRSQRDIVGGTLIEYEDKIFIFYNSLLKEGIVTSPYGAVPFCWNGTILGAYGYQCTMR